MAATLPRLDSEVERGASGKILIIGNSHTQLIKDAIEIRTVSGQPVSGEIEICWVMLGGKGNFGDTALDDALTKIRSLRSSDLMAVSLIGTLHNMIGMFTHKSPFSLATGSSRRPELPPGGQTIPQNVMSDVFRDSFDGVSVFRQMVEAARCLVVHFMPPPPKETFAKDRKWRIIDGVQVQLEYAPKYNRLALWKLEEQEVARHLARLGVYHYSVPLTASTPEGFLRPDYHANDATHANAAFGELLLQDFERMLLGLPRNP